MNERVFCKKKKKTLVQYIYYIYILLRGGATAYENSARQSSLYAIYLYSVHYPRCCTTGGPPKLVGSQHSYKNNVKNRHRCPSTMSSPTTHTRTHTLDQFNPPLRRRRAVFPRQPRTAGWGRGRITRGASFIDWLSAARKLVARHADRGYRKSRLSRSTQTFVVVIVIDVRMPIKYVFV